MTNDERSRQVAEAMGLQECCDHPNVRHVGKCDAWRKDWTCNVRAFDLADARDREVVIAWLVGRGCAVRIDHAPDGHTVIIWTKDDPQSTKGAYPCATIEEAFGQAVLAAIGGEQ